MWTTLDHFLPLPPRFERKQEEILEWLLKAHTEAEAKKQGWKEEEFAHKEKFKQTLSHLLDRTCKRSAIIQKRGMEFNDYLHENWESMNICQFISHPDGAPIEARMALYEEAADRAFALFYPEVPEELHHVIHVTCTGYSAPSAAQRRFSLTPRPISITHAYHMGCYAAIPAIRMGEGTLYSSLHEKNSRVDIVHTEFCTLHFNPSLHDSANLVVQSLFADGSIRYSIQKENEKKGLVIHRMLETLIPETVELMNWKMASWGFQFLNLSPNIPEKITSFLPQVLEKLIDSFPMSVESLKKKAIFAIHPGGPKIVSGIAKELDLTHEQIEHTEQILATRGNMSSATLPYIWNAILQDPKIKEGTLIVSLAFGPGLTVACLLLEKGATS